MDVRYAFAFRSPVRWREGLPRWLPVAAALALLPACGGDSSGPPTPSTITVESPAGDLLDVATTVQLQARALNGQGDPISGLSFTWSSSNPSAVSVSSSGRVTAEGVGTSTVSASTSGRSGSLQLRVVEADLTAVATLTGDPYPDSLVSGLTTATRPDVETAWDACATGADQDNLRTVKDCVDDIGSEAASATDGTDEALLAVLVLFTEQIERYLGL